MSGVTHPDKSDDAISTTRFFIMTTIQSITSLGTLCQCALECSRQSRWKEHTQRFLIDLLPRALKIQEEVRNGSYRVKPTNDFIINERGHIRHIESPAICDRDVQKSLMKQVLTPSLRPCLIYDNYASLTQRGTDFARKRFRIMLQRYIQKYGTDGYILLGDVSKYFENVDHEILKRLIAPKIANESDDVKRLIYYIIDTSSKTCNGLNLGGEPPQIFAVYYLNRLDQFVKVVKGVKYYGRYMDDFFVIGRTKKELRNLLEEIRGVLASLGLSINDKKTHIIRLSHSFTWLQIKYIIKPTGKILRVMSHDKIVRERRRLKAFRRQVDEGNMTDDDVWQCYQSWRGSQKKDHTNCHRSLTKMDHVYSSMFKPANKRPRQKRSDIVRQVNREAELIDFEYINEIHIQPHHADY
jgi:hypothetical protein